MPKHPIPKTPIPHGTLGGYTNHHCRCAKCTEAQRVAVARARARRVANPTPRHVHGSENGYLNYGCRCKRCTKAHTDANRMRRGQ